MKHKATTPALFALIVGILLLTFNQSTNAQSALDGFDPNANSTVRAIAVQADGKILIGGDFTTVSGVTRNSIARLNTDGTLDTAFNPNANGPVFSIAVQSDGKILAGGQFTTIGGQTRNFIARLDSISGLVDSFDPNASSAVYSLAIHTDGKILAGGNFTTIGGQSRNRLARLDASTGLADSFAPNGNNDVTAIVIQSDGKIIVSGTFITIGGQSRNRLARLDSSTGLADSWNPSVNNAIFALAIQADGKILVGGQYSVIGGQLRNNLARIDAGTGLADSWNPDANSRIYSIAVQADGKILVGGLFTTVGGQTLNRLARLDSISGLADSFNPNVNSDVRSIAVQSDGKILIGGLFTTIGGQTRNRIARLERDGGVDRTLDINLPGGSLVIAIAIQPDGKIIIGGQFTSVLGTPRNNIARLNPDGTLDTAFNPNANNLVYSIAVQTDGKILIGGLFNGATAINGNVTRNYIARLNANGSVDTAFNPNANGNVQSIAVQPDGKILIGGAFSGANSINGNVTRNRIARLETNGLVDTAFNPNANNQVLSIAVQPDGKILIGGAFNGTNSINGNVTRNRIARLETNGSVDTAFDPNANDTVYAIALAADGKILIGGDFNGANSINGNTTRNRIARLDANGAVDTAFNPNANNTVFAIAVQSDGKIIIGGSFLGQFAINGTVMRNRIARLNANGIVDTTFDPNANNAVYAIAVQSDGKILIGGVFNGAISINGSVSRNHFARLSNNTPALSTLAVTQTTLTLTRDGSAPQFERVIFEQSIDNGATYTLLGTATNSFASVLGFKGGNASVNERVDTVFDTLPEPSRVSALKSENSFAPTAADYTLTGLNLPTGQNVLIRARGFYRTGLQSGSETIEDKVQNVYLLAPTAANVSVSGSVMVGKGTGLKNALVILTDSDGNSRTVQTGSFGYFKFDDVAVGQTYFVTVQSKRYRFAPQIISVADNITDLNFTAEP